MSEEEDTGKAPDIVLFKSDIEAAAARVAERAFNETWTGASGFLGDVFGGLVGDRVKQWRTRNLVDTLAKTKNHLESKGVNIDAAKSLPMGELLVIFEGASKTDDFDLSSMWAALLSNGMNPKVDTFIDPSFPRLLASLSGLDARILKYVSDYEHLFQTYLSKAEVIWASLEKWESTDPKFLEAKETHDQLVKVLTENTEKLEMSVIDGTTQEHLSYSLSNLLRLGLLLEAKDGVSYGTLLRVDFDRDFNVKVNSRNLERVLDELRDGNRLGYETDKELLEVSKEDRFMSRIRKPAYALSGYAKRFLNACT
mgnify:CR=1 FL=1